jgi:hypothetical protein
MKKIIAVIFFTVIIMNSSKAQFSIGPKFGLNYSRLTNIANDSGSMSRSIPGFNAGVAFNFSLGNAISFQPEILLIQKGCWIEAEGNKNIYTKFTTTNYEIPFILKYSFGQENVGFFIDAGPYLSYWARKKQIYHYDTLVTETYSDKTDEGDTKLDLGICFGGGTSVNAGPGKIMLSLRYDLGFTNIIQGNDPANCNRSYGISLAYLFNLGKNEN